MQLTKQLLHTTDAYIKKLADAGILTAQDFLQLYPKSIEDRNAQGSRFSQLDIRSKVAIEVEIISLTTEMTRNKKHLTKAVVADVDGLYAHAFHKNFTRAIECSCLES
jgi:RecG-like helicase